MENYPELSIVIPTLNEEHFLKRTVDHLLANARDPRAIELIIVDAGSTDQTATAIDGATVRWYSNAAFRLKKYESLNFGLQKAKASVVLFLDADTLLPRAFDHEVLKSIRSGYVGGAFEMRFLNADFRLYVLSKLNQLRYRIWKNCFGDQAIFCAKEEALMIGGFPKTLMEAAYFCKRLRQQGRIKILDKRVLTSPRRFKENGFWIVLWFDIRMWVRFVLGLPLERQTTRYWEKNMKNG